MTQPVRAEGLSGVFRTFSHKASQWLGSSWAFITALGIVLLWALSGPIFGFSENWQLIINTGTTIVTFLMIFLVQNTQNRDTMAIQLKLDELLRGTSGPRTGLVHLEDLSDEQLRDLQHEFEHLAEKEPLETAEASDRKLAEKEVLSPTESEDRHLPAGRR